MLATGSGARTLSGFRRPRGRRGLAQRGMGITVISDEERPPATSPRHGRRRPRRRDGAVGVEGTPLGIVADGAIAVDAAMATPVGGVHAIGDIVKAWNDAAGRRLRVEHWGDGHDAVQVQPSVSGVTIWYGRDDVVVGMLTCDHDDERPRRGRCGGHRALADAGPSLTGVDGLGADRVCRCPMGGT